MKKIALLLSLIVSTASAVSAEPVPGALRVPGGLGQADPGAIMSSYIDPVVPNTYENINADDLGLSKENPKDVINVEKKDVFGNIIINPEPVENPAGQ